jgi:hypothetical protein
MKVEIGVSQGTPKKYKWNNDSTVLFQEALLTNDIQQKIENFNNTEYKADTDDIMVYL